MKWNELSIQDKADIIKQSVKNGIYNISQIKDNYNIYANGGYKPSESIKRQIANWEGSSMKTNRPFSAEANDFNRYLPKDAINKLSQQQLDALYSYSYNVGAGKFNERVVPTLNKYLQGKATKEDVQKSMWASKDNQLRGLTNRRNTERQMFGGKYRTVFTGTGAASPNYSNNDSESNPFQIKNEEWQGKNYLDSYKGIQLSMNDIIGKKDNQLPFSTATGPTIDMSNLLAIGRNDVAPIQPDYSYSNQLLSDFDNDLTNPFNNNNLSME